MDTQTQTQQSFYNSLHLSSVYNDENQKSQLAVSRDEQYEVALGILVDAYKQQDIKNIIQLEKIFYNAALTNAGSSKLNSNARNSAVASIDRATSAIVCLESFEKGYDFYKKTIHEAYSGDIDSQGLPKDAVRKFINAQRASIRNQDSNVFIDTSNPFSTPINNQRRKNLDLIEKKYKEGQIKLMKLYIVDQNYDTSIKSVRLFMKAHNIKDPNINQAPDQTQNNSVQFKSPKNDLEH